MRKLIMTPRFERAYRSFVKRDRALQERVGRVLKQMEEDVFVPALGTHKLGGSLSGLWASSCGYDCRVVFSFEQDEDNHEAILLLHIGSHNEVY